MAHINAHFLTLAGKDWLANSSHPRILHVFDHACNLINERREVLSIVATQIGNGPFNLVVEDDVLFSEHLSLQSLISNSTNHLNLGGFSLHMADAEFWLPHPDWEVLHARRGNILNQIMALRAGDSKRSNFHKHEEIDARGLEMPLPRLRLIDYESPISNLQFSNSLPFALANADLPASLTAAQKLAGLGIGLTPAGDDFILGAILAAWIIHPADVAGVLAEEVANVAAALTTSLSAAWLRSAGRGEAGILWHQFFNALLAGDSFDIQLKITKLLSMGHTSGADALAGFLSVFISWEDAFRRDSQPKVIG